MITSEGRAKHEVFGKTERRGRATNGATLLRFVITKKCDAKHRIPLVRMTGLVARERSVIAIVAQYAPIVSAAQVQVANIVCRQL